MERARVKKIRRLRAGFAQRPAVDIHLATVAERDLVLVDLLGVGVVGVGARQVADRGKPFGTDGSRGNVTASLNFNMDELHGCIGRVQLARLPEFVAIRRARGNGRSRLATSA